MECLSAVSILVLISFLTFGLVSAQNGNCSFIPISLPIKDTTLSNNAALRGISLGIGAPAQSFSVLPILEINNTYLYDADVGCATDNTQSYCITKQGGTFAQGKSRTFQSVANAGAAGAETSENITIPSPSNWGQDNLGLGSDRAVQGFPLGLLDPNINTHSLVIGLGRAALGLGKNSAVLSKLKSAGFIGSRTFGLWWGLAGATPAAQVEGSLVFGGYDAAKIKSGGKNHTGSITEATLCPSGMTITIASMVLNFPNGTNPSLLDPSLGGALLQACICLQCSLVLMMPLDPYYQRFETLTNTDYIDRSMGISFFNMLYPSSDVYQGDLTITLDSGFSVQIPNSKLVQPDQKISDTGDVVSNTSVSNVNLYSLQDTMRNDFPLLGFRFFTAAYLMVNHDAGTFTMWEANPTTDTKLVAIPADDTTSACTAITNSTLTAASGASTPSAQAQPAGERNPLSTGTLAGIVLGGVAAFVAMGLLLFWLFRRHNPNQAKADISRLEKDGRSIGSLHPVELSRGPPPELEEQPLRELRAGSWRNSSKSLHPRYEMG